MHRLMWRMALGCAFSGGLALIFVVLVTCLSIVGRLLNSALYSPVMRAFAPELSERVLATGVGSIHGDFELVEVSIAFAVFMFLPLCQLSGAHASVDVFTCRFSIGIQRCLKALSELFFAIVLLFITWGLFAGLQTKMRYGETSFLLQFPIWWPYAACLIGGAVASAVSIYSASLHLYAWRADRDVPGGLPWESDI